MKTIVLGKIDPREIRYFVRGEIICLKSPEELRDIKGQEEILYLDLTEGLNFDLKYFLKFSKPDCLGLFYQENIGDEVLYLDAHFKIRKIKNPEIYDGFSSAKIFFGKLSVLQEIIRGNYSNVSGLPMGRNEGYRNLPKIRNALFLDRDGVINVDLGYIYQIEKIKIYKEVIPLIKAANRENMLVIVLTNQSGVARGLYTEEEVIKVNEYLDKQIKEMGARVDKWYFSPFHPEGAISAYRKHSILRKPGPGMALKACEDFPIDISKSYMVGDKLSDNLLLKGLNCINIKRGNDLSGSKFPVFEHLEQIYDYIFS